MMALHPSSAAHNHNEPYFDPQVIAYYKDKYGTSLANKRTIAPKATTRAPPDISDKEDTKQKVLLSNTKQTPPKPELSRERQLLSQFSIRRDRPTSPQTTLTVPPKPTPRHPAKPKPVGGQSSMTSSTPTLHKTVHVNRSTIIDSSMNPNENVLAKSAAPRKASLVSSTSTPKAKPEEPKVPSKSPKPLTTNPAITPKPTTHGSRTLPSSTKPVPPKPVTAKSPTPPKPASKSPQSIPIKRKLSTPTGPISKKLKRDIKDDYDYEDGFVLKDSSEYLPLGNLLREIGYTRGPTSVDLYNRLDPHYNPSKNTKHKMLEEDDDECMEVNSFIDHCEMDAKTAKRAIEEDKKEREKEKRLKNLEEHKKQAKKDNPTNATTNTVPTGRTNIKSASLPSIKFKSTPNKEWLD